MVCLACVFFFGGGEYHVNGIVQPVLILSQAIYTVSVKPIECKAHQLLCFHHAIREMSSVVQKKGAHHHDVALSLRGNNSITQQARRGEEGNSPHS